MENKEIEKYYVPNFEELTPIFIYEVLENNKWKQVNDFTNAYDYEDSPSYGFAKDLEKGNIRVKFLDKSDIESCQWKYVFDDCYVSGEVHYNVYKKDDIYLHYSIMDNKLSIHNRQDWDDFQHYFTGTIKNINELKILLKQIDFK